MCCQKQCCKQSSFSVSVTLIADAIRTQQTTHPSVEKKGGDDEIVMLKQKENCSHGTVSKAVSVSPCVASVWTGLHCSTKIAPSLYMAMLLMNKLIYGGSSHYAPHVSNTVVVCCFVCQALLPWLCVALCVRPYYSSWTARGQGFFSSQVAWQQQTNILQCNTYQQAY